MVVFRTAMAPPRAGYRRHKMKTVAGTGYASLAGDALPPRGACKMARRGGARQPGNQFATLPDLSTA